MLYKSSCKRGFVMVKCKCTKCGHVFDEDELKSLWNNKKGPKEVECDDPGGAVIGGLLGAAIGSIAGPLGAVAGAAIGALLFGKEKRKRPE